MKKVCLSIFVFLFLCCMGMTGSSASAAGKDAVRCDHGNKRIKEQLCQDCQVVTARFAYRRQKLKGQGR